MSNLPWPLNSRKSIAALVGIAVMLVLLATKQVDAETATNGIIALVGVLIASIAYEDAASKTGASVTHIQATTKDDRATVTTTSGAITPGTATAGGETVTQ